PSTSAPLCPATRSVPSRDPVYSWRCYHVPVRQQPKNGRVQLPPARSVNRAGKGGVTAATRVNLPSDLPSRTSSSVTPPGTVHPRENCVCDSTPSVSLHFTQVCAVGRCTLLGIVLPALGNE